MNMGNIDMPINSINPTQDQYYLGYLIDAVIASLRSEKMAFVLAVQYQGQELLISHYSDATETHSAICRAVQELEAVA
jgi:hypothetical protein